MITRIKSLIAVLEDGSMLLYNNPVDFQQNQNAEVFNPTGLIIDSTAQPVIQPQTTTVETETVTTPKRRRGRPRKTQTPVETTAQTVVETTAPAPAQSTEAKANGKPSRMAICIPLTECLGVASYKKKDGNGCFDVAIYKTGNKRNGKKWFKLLFVSKDNEWAYHQTDRNGFWGKEENIVDIMMF